MTSLRLMLLGESSVQLSSFVSERVEGRRNANELSFLASDGEHLGTDVNRSDASFVSFRNFKLVTNTTSSYFIIWINLFGKEEIRNGGAKGHSGAVVLHFSGCGVKPWDLIFTRYLAEKSENFDPVKPFLWRSRFGSVKMGSKGSN